eukprot:GHVN01090639.1.p1 GENE.GHVN01090639.1~~GHVN01090639.1.p1  ORF type:complete len:263 (+),score=50.36 GHVN01090639.1:94-882(+)
MSSSPPQSPVDPQQALHETVQLLLAECDPKFTDAHTGQPSFSVIETLEHHVEQQIQGHVPYSIKCNLALLRYYALAAPQYSKANLEVCRKVLIKALMALPDTHYSECLSLIPTSFAKRELESLTNLEDKLQSCNFRNFWEYLQTDPAVADLVRVPGFCEAIRSYMAEVLALTYSSIALTDFAALLNIGENSAELSKLLADNHWEIEAPATGTGAQVKPYVRLSVVGEGASPSGQVSESWQLNKDSIKGWIGVSQGDGGRRVR